MPFRRVISEGTTGVGRGALMAARATCLKTGGFVRSNLRTDTPNCFWLLGDYGFETLETDYRTDVIRRCIEEADAVVVVHEIVKAGLSSHGEGAAMVGHAKRFEKPAFLLGDVSTMWYGYRNEATPLANWILDGGYETVFFAGDREAYNEGVQRRSYRFLRTVFERVARVQSVSPLEAREYYLYDGSPT